MITRLRIRFRLEEGFSPLDRINKASDSGRGNKANVFKAHDSPT